MTRRKASVLGAVAALLVMLWLLVPLARQVDTTAEPSDSTDRPSTSAPASGAETPQATVVPAVDAAVRSAEPPQSTQPRAITSAIASAMLQMLADDTLFPELVACSAAHGLYHETCRAQLDAAIDRVLWWQIGRELAAGDRFSIAAVLRAHGADPAASGAHRAMEQTLLESDNPVVRVAALALAERLASESSMPQPALRAELYEHLSSRTSAERRYLLSAYEQAPVRAPAVLEELASLALSDSASIAERRHAVRAIAAAGAAAEFEAVLSRLERSGGVTVEGALHVIGPGLARCGTSCGATMRRLATQPNANSRLAVLQALAIMDDATRALAARDVLPMLEAAPDRSATEDDQLAFVVRKLRDGTQARP